MKREDLKIGQKVLMIGEESVAPFTVTKISPRHPYNITVTDRFGMDWIGDPKKLFPLNEGPGGWWCDNCGRFVDKIEVITVVTTTYDRIIELDPDNPITLRDLQKKADWIIKTGKIAGCESDRNVAGVVCVECDQDLSWECEEGGK